MEQTYLKLNDHSVRPILTENNIDTSNPMYRDIRKQLIVWSDETETESIVKEWDKILSDLIIYTSGLNHNGYELAKYMEDRYYVSDIDSELVDILDTIYILEHSLKESLYKQWVKECFLSIPEDVKHKKVKFKKTSHINYTGFIVGFKQSTYQVVINTDSPDYDTGYIVNFENIIEFLN